MYVCTKFFQQQIPVFMETNPNIYDLKDLRPY